MKYSEMTDGEFYSVFRNSNWKDLSAEGRIEALQEAVNRTGISCPVSYSSMQPTTNGYYSPSSQSINMNERYSKPHAGGKEYDAWGSELESPGFKHLQTVLHESRHAYQDAVVRGDVKHDNAQETMLWRANTGGVVAMEQDGEVKWGSCYLNGRGSFDDYLLYRVQPIELDADRYAEARMADILGKQEELLRSGKMTETDASDLASVKAYQNTAATRSSVFYLNEAKTEFGDTVEEDVGATIYNTWSCTDDMKISDSEISSVAKGSMQRSYENSQAHQQTNTNAQTNTQGQSSSQSRGMSM